MAKKLAGGENGSRWRRRLFTYFSAVSLLLCVAVCGLWADSYLATNSLDRRSDLSIDIRSARGRLVVDFTWYGNGSGVLARPWLVERGRAVTAQEAIAWVSASPPAG